MYQFRDSVNRPWCCSGVCLCRNVDHITAVLTCLCPSLPVEHRPSTTPRHRTLFWAALVIPDQLVPCCFSSASVSHLHLLRGKAWRVVLDAGFLRVCPIQPHFLRSICLATGSLLYCVFINVETVKTSTLQERVLIHFWR